jgi:hypothetical protein
VWKVCKYGDATKILPYFSQNASHANASITVQLNVRNSAKSWSLLKIFPDILTMDNVGQAYKKRSSKIPPNLEFRGFAKSQMCFNAIPMDQEPIFRWVFNNSFQCHIMATFRRLKDWDCLGDGDFKCSRVGGINGERGYFGYHGSIDDRMKLK